MKKPLKKKRPPNKKPNWPPALKQAARIRGAKLLAARLEFGMNQHDFGELFGLCSRGYAMLERGEHVGISSSTALAMSIQTKLSLQDLIIG